MKIWLLRLFDGKFEKFSLAKIDNIELKDSDILLLFSGKFEYYDYKYLSAKDKNKVANNLNLASSIEFRVSRSLKIYFDKQYKNIKNTPLYSSLSHSKNHAILAISHKPVGVDLEFIKDRDFKAHMDFCFSNKQRAKVEKSKEPLIEFYRIWTLKEARIKLFNLGFYALDRVGDENLKSYSCAFKSGDMDFIYTATTF